MITNEQRMLACCLDQDWYNHYGLIVCIPAHFDNPDERLIAEYLNNFYSQYQRTPTESEMLHMLNGKVQQDSVYNTIVANIYQCFGNDNLDYYKNVALEFAENKGTLLLLLNAAEKLYKLPPGQSSLALRNELLTNLQKVQYQTSPWLTATDVGEDTDNVQWLVENMLEAGDMFCLFGESGIGKTWFMLLLSAYIATGKNFLGYKCQPATIFWIDQENREKRFKRRLRAVIKSIGDIGDKFHYKCMPKPAIYANNPSSMNELANHVNSYPGNKMIVFDNLGSISDVKSMNDSSMKEVMLALNRLADETNATVVTIHHKPKNGDTMFGSQYIKAYTDFALEMTSMEGKSNTHGGLYGKHVSLLTGFKERDEEVPPMLVEFIIDRYVNREAINPRFVRLEDASLSKAKAKLDKTGEMKLWLLDNPTEIIGMGIKEAAQHASDISNKGGFMIAHKAITQLREEGLLLVENQGKKAIVMKL